MRTQRVRLLKNLIDIPSPSGFEAKIAEFIRTELLTVLPRTQVKRDFQNNVVATIKGKTNKTVMIDTHLDEIAFIVNNISGNGIISLQQIGHCDNQILSARHLQILTERGKINAVVDRKHSHLVDDEDDEKIDSISTAQIDVGSRSRKAVSSRVKIGDPVVYKPYFEELLEDKTLGKFVTGYGLDDKSGCLILIETIKDIIKEKKKPTCNLIFTFSAQEETGYTKARPLVKKYRPDLFIEVDVTFATDYGENDDLERKAGRCELGKGIVLYRGVDIDRDSLKLITSIARNHRIKYQLQASTGDIGYTATEVTYTPTRALILGIPLRNMHTPVEIVNMKDIGYGINLLKCFCLSQNLKEIFE